MDNSNGKPAGGRIYFGSLENVEAKNRQAAAAAAAANPDTTPAATQPKGTTLDSLKVDDKYELADSSKRARDQHLELLEMFERKKRARTVKVPTDDKEVRAKLRELDEPVCLFGEDNIDRRARLRNLLAKDAVDEGGDEKMASGDEEKSDSEDETYANHSSQVGDDRPLSQCTFSPDSQYIATGSWGGLCKIWNVANSQLSHTLRGHTDKIGGLKWHPKANLDQDRAAVNLASSGGEGLVHLWSLESDTPIRTLKGHEARVARIGFHPTGRFLGSAAYDGTWRLWDIETGTELLTQRGHSREVYAIGFQCDGSLAATGGLDAVGRVWDLRTGRSALTMEGHVSDILGIDFSPNGYQIATGSADNTIRIWDLRALRSIHSIPAHTNLVSDIKFFAGSPLNDSDTQMQVEEEAPRPSRSGLYLGSSSFDGTIKIWSADDWKLQKSLVGHTGKVLGMDISNDGRYIGSVGFDRTFKLWAPEAADY
ncbi:U4/U6 small nuclear ribonucleoprotein Prp4 [Linnemannia zychae]|nr:U4/U6 small nuclear ribonucleoprotein Prp4 [Linnemannia zychae]